MGSGRRNVGNSLLDHAHRHHLPKGETHHLELQPASHICHLEKGVEDQSRGVKTTVEDFHSLSGQVPPFTSPTPSSTSTISSSNNIGRKPSHHCEDVFSLSIVIGHIRDEDETN